MVFNPFKRNNQKTLLKNKIKKDQEDETKDIITSASGVTATESAHISTQQARKTFLKPDSYTGNRQLYDSASAKRNVKIRSFADSVEVHDPYTDQVLVLRKADAKRLFGEDWQSHLAEGDHIVPIEKIFEALRNNPWITNENMNSFANSADNLQTVSRRFNNAKRSRSNEEFVTDQEYLDKTGIKLSEEQRKKAIEAGKKSQSIIDRKANLTAAKNIIETGHNAGVEAAQRSGTLAATMSGIINLTAVIKGEKEPEEAISDILVDGGKATATGYILGGGLTTLSHSLSSSSSQFVQALANANVPGNVITAIMLTGNTLKRYGNGEISTQECILEIGEKGLNVATTGYAMTVGQALIPIPIVGAAVGALVGSVLTSQYYNQLVKSLRVKELEHNQRQRIIQECQIVAQNARAYRAELEEYLEIYFKDYHHCFDEALAEIRLSLQSGNADGVISSTNKITRKLGGKVYYDTVDEFTEFIFADTIDLL